MRRLLVAGLTAGMSWACGQGANSGDRARASLSAPPAAYLAGTESRLVASTATGRTYQISVALPRGYANAGPRYPTLYVVDANGLFGTVVESARLLQAFDGSVPELIVVGIGYPVGGLFAFHAMLAVDGTFRRFIIGSPGYWWDDNHSFEREALELGSHIFENETHNSVVSAAIGRGLAFVYGRPGG